MPGHIKAHLAAGHRHWGVFYLKPRRGHLEYADALRLVWEEYDADVWLDSEGFIPF
jgi:hypothetical protein